MRKMVSLMAIGLMVVLMSGCSLLGQTTVQNESNTASLVHLFDYTRVDVEPNTVLVRSQSLTTLDELLAPEGAEVIKTWPAIDWALVSVPVEREAVEFAKELRNRKGILLAMPNMRYELQAAKPTGELYPDQWGFGNIGTESGWQVTTGSPNVIVAIIDSGVQIDHPEFAGKTFVGAYDATTGFSNVSDHLGHGTHVAGIAADDGRTGDMAGVAWDSPIMPIKIADEGNHVYASYLVDAFLYLGTYMRDRPHQRAVANISYGTRGYDFALKDAIDYAVENGVVVVAAAGNDGKRAVNYPAAFNGVISVAASNPYNQPAAFSTKGSWNSVAAPGVEILSTYCGSLYAWMNGTSMASPFVAGAAALLLATDPYLTPLEVKNQIEQTAFGSGFSEELGYGILNIPAMLGLKQHMMYGSLEVQTNILPPTNDAAPFTQGMITLLDKNGQLVSFGLTGEYGNHIFHALQPGPYTVQLSYPDPYQKDKYWFQTTQAIVVASSKLTVEIMNVPVNY